MTPISGWRFAWIAIVDQDLATGFYEYCSGKKSMIRKGVQCNLAWSWFSDQVPLPFLEKKLADGRNRTYRLEKWKSLFCRMHWQKGVRWFRCNQKSSSADKIPIVRNNLACGFKSDALNADSSDLMPSKSYWNCVSRCCDVCVKQRLINDYSSRKWDDSGLRQPTMPMYTSLIYRHFRRFESVTFSFAHRSLVRSDCDNRPICENACAVLYGNRSTNAWYFFNGFQRN